VVLSDTEFSFPVVLSAA